MIRFDTNPDLYPDPDGRADRNPHGRADHGRADRNPHRLPAFGTRDPNTYLGSTAEGNPDHCRR